MYLRVAQLLRAPRCLPQRANILHRRLVSILAPHRQRAGHRLFESPWQSVQTFTMVLLGVDKPAQLHCLVSQPQAGRLAELRKALGQEVVAAREALSADARALADDMVAALLRSRQ